MPLTHKHRHDPSTLLEVGTLLRLGVAFAIFVTVLIIEIRAVAKAKYPMLRACVSMAVVIPLFLIFFAWIYLTMSNINPATFDGAMDRTTALYFTVTVFATVGFGDITPRTDLARLITTVQMLADLAVVAIVIRLILGVATRSTVARHALPVDDAGQPVIADSD